ncbi:hypothetical protein MHI57_14575 [Cytobacillus sp. FSL K6-0129]
MRANREYAQKRVWRKGKKCAQTGNTRKSEWRKGKKCAQIGNTRKSE